MPSTKERHNRIAAGSTLASILLLGAAALITTLTSALTVVALSFIIGGITIGSVGAVYWYRSTFLDPASTNSNGIKPRPEADIEPSKGREIDPNAPFQARVSKEREQYRANDPFIPSK